MFPTPFVFLSLFYSGIPGLLLGSFFLLQFFFITGGMHTASDQKLEAEKPGNDASIAYVTGYIIVIRPTSMCKTNCTGKVMAMPM